MFFFIKKKSFSISEIRDPTRALQSSQILRKKFWKNHFFCQKKSYPFSFPILGGNSTKALQSSPFQISGGQYGRDGGGRTNERTKSLCLMQNNTRSYSPLCGLTCSSCGGVPPLAEFFALWANKRAFKVVVAYFKPFLVFSSILCKVYQ